MMKTYIVTLLLTMAAALGVKAQVTSSPTPLQEDSQNVTIYFHADEGNKALMNQPADAKIYAHTGVYLNNVANWVNAPSWGDNADKYRLEYVSPNVWRLYIGDIREYYGITNPADKVTKLCFVFRTASNKPQTEDLFLTVVDSGLQILLESDASSNVLTPDSPEVTFNVTTTESADISLRVNDTVLIGGATDATSLTASYNFTEPGDYEVVATATKGDKTVSATSSFTLLGKAVEEDYPGGTPKMGPVRNDDGSVTFCIGAPGKTNVMIIGAWNDYAAVESQQMKMQEVDGMRYFWTTIEGLDNDRQYGYYFLVDAQLKVGDPYARLVLDPWNDKYISTDVYPDLPAYPVSKIRDVPLAIYQGNINDYDWEVTDFKGVKQSDLVIYELLFRDFTGTEGQSKGNGTVRQAIEKIPYLKTLGVNAIEVLPIMEFNGNISWGYNPNFYFAPDKAYGTPEDYKEFIDICHQNGMAVILDMVFNQSDGLHPWYQMYTPGNNPFYNLDAPHAYSVLNDWNQGFPMVQEQWRDVLEYWMKEYRFDGFRFDLVKGLGDNSSYSSNSDAATNAYNQSRIDRMIALQEIVKGINPDAYFINEDLATAKEENAMGAYGQMNWANVNEAGCQFAMGYQTDSNLNRMYAPKDGSRLWGSTVAYLESHDEQRLAYKQNQWGVAGVKGDLGASMHRLGSAAAQMILVPGAHMIWQFSELGNDQNTKNSDGGNNTDPKKVCWNLLNDPDRKGLYDNYSEMIDIRTANSDLFAEDAVFEMNCGAGNWANGRSIVSKKDDKELITIINPNADKALTMSVTFGKESQDAYQILSKSYNSEPSFSVAEGTVTVPANCYVTIGSKEVSAVESVEIPGADKLRVYGADGVITVDYADAPVSVYSIDGRKVATLSGSGKAEVGTGVFIVVSGAEKRKIAL